MSDAEQPIGAPVLEPVVEERGVRAGYSFDVAAVVEMHVERHPGVELLSMEAGSRLFGLRQYVRIAVRGSEWDIARFWDDVIEDLPRQTSWWAPFDVFDWFS